MAEATTACSASRFRRLATRRSRKCATRNRPLPADGVPNLPTLTRFTCTADETFMTACPPNIQDLAEEFLMHRLDNTTAEAFRTHASLCPECAYEVDRERHLMRAIRETLTDWFARVDELPLPRQRDHYRYACDNPGENLLSANQESAILPRQSSVLPYCARVDHAIPPILFLHFVSGNTRRRIQ
jgi:hypothetical protein